jgi:ectoine hydroxylase-related dioxygenase (phytanoyl-CoA dioxygenase family)
VDTPSCIEQNGFAILPAVLSPSEAQQLIDEIGHSSLQRSKAGIRHALRHPAITSLARERRLLDLAREFLGGEATPFRATVFDKSPAANWLVVWHQDTALPLCKRRDTPGWGPWSVKDGVVYAHAPASALCRVTALRVHLDDSTKHNGPLRVLPGTHKLGVLSDDAIEKLATQIAPVDCLVPEGGVLAMKPLLIHASSKSQVKAPRRVLHIEYAETTTVGTGLELAVPKDDEFRIQNLETSSNPIPTATRSSGMAITASGTRRLRTSLTRA